MVIIWCGFSHYQSRHRKHNISSTRGEYHVTPEHVKSHSTHTEGEDYFHLTAERGTPKHTSVGRPTSLGKGISGDDSQYAPLTPSSLEDKEFTTETEEKEVGHSTSPRTSNDSEITRPLLSSTHETSLIAEIEQSFKSGSPLPGPPEPPSLPPKKSNLNKPPRPAQPAVLSSNNNSNNNKEQLPPPPLCVLLAETPEKKTPDNLPEVIPVQMRHPIDSPPTSNPPPPRPKMGLRKHQTFSGPHGQKIKPPVPPKSSSIGRAASMRVPPVRTSSLRTPVTPTPVTPTPTNPTLPPPPLLPQTKSTSPVRPQSRLPIHVEPPVVPSDKSFSST